MTQTIGSQTNVPDVGDPITSPWYQDTARKIVHTFANVTARDAWASPPEGAMCVTTDTGTTWVRKSAVWRALSVKSSVNGFGSDSTELQISASTTVVTTNASGDVNIAFEGVAFVSPPLVLVNSGDPSAAGTGGMIVAVYHTLTTTTGTAVRCYGSGGTPIGNVTVRLDYIAIGRR